MSRKTDAVIVSTIGIDTGKNTLHLIQRGDLLRRSRTCPIIRRERSRLVLVELAVRVPARWFADGDLSLTGAALAGRRPLWVKSGRDALNFDVRFTPESGL